jgi:hypothetical protein
VVGVAGGHLRACASVLAVLASAALPACAARSVAHWDQPAVPAALPGAGPVFVMRPLVAGSASPGNVGRDFDAIIRDVAARLLAAVRQQYAQAQLVDDRLIAGARPSGDPGSASQTITRAELEAASAAARSGATHLIVPTITVWTEMRTDDPIGAVTLPHNRVSITLRLMRLEPPAVAAALTFEARARLTTNRKAIDLLDDRFRAAVLQLLAGHP